MLHQAVDLREPGRGVVELQIAREGGVPGQHHRRRKGGEGAHSGGHRPWVDPRPAARAKQPQACDSKGDRERGRKLRGRVRRHRELRQHHDQRHPGWKQQRAGQAKACDAFEQQAAAERQQRQHQRKPQPTDDQGQGVGRLAWIARLNGPGRPVPM